MWMCGSAPHPATALCSYRQAGCDKDFLVENFGILHQTANCWGPTSPNNLDGATELLDKMATPSLAERLDKIKSPGLQSQQRVSE